jgi:hypothetical protein
MTSRVTSNNCQVLAHQIIKASLNLAVFHTHQKCRFGSDAAEAVTSLRQLQPVKKHLDRQTAFLCHFFALKFSSTLFISRAYNVHLVWTRHVPIWLSTAQVKSWTCNLKRDRYKRTYLQHQRPYLHMCTASTCDGKNQGPFLPTYLVNVCMFHSSFFIFICVTIKRLETKTWIFTYVGKQRSSTKGVSPYHLLQMMYVCTQMASPLCKDFFYLWQLFSANSYTM